MGNPFQNNGEWLRERCGKLTASRMADAMFILSRDSKSGKKGEPGAAQINYARELVTERMTGICTEHFVTKEMEWGVQYEPEARERYIALTGNEVQLVGFVDHAWIEYCGASPDGLVREMWGDLQDPEYSGLVECKCPTSITHRSYLEAGTVPEEYKPQMLLQMSVTGREWCDFVSYDPRNKYRPLFVKRYTPTTEEIANIEAHAIRFLKYVDELFEKITGA